MRLGVIQKITFDWAKLNENYNLRIVLTII